MAPMTQFIAVVVIAVLVSSAVAAGVSMVIPGPEGPEGPQGEQGIQGEQGERGFGMPQTGNISVSAFDFVPPASDIVLGYSYSNGLTNGETVTLMYCYAPLQLPHGATITNATFYFYDNDVSYFEFYLVRQNLTGWMTFAQVNNAPGADTPGYADVSLSSISSGYATVDNNNYYYYLAILFPYSSTSQYYYRFYYALVEYELPA